MQKVVACSDIPDTSTATNPYFVDAEAIDASVATWLSLTSLWSPTEANFTGCGYLGTDDQISAIKFQDGCDACLKEDQAYGSTSDLIWLWVSMIVVGLLALGIVTMCCMKKKQAPLDGGMLYDR